MKANLLQTSFLDIIEVDSNGRIEKDIKVIDKNLEIIETKRILRDTEIIEISRTGNYLKMYDKEINIPLEIIVFPFFTTRLNNRDVNYEYRIIDMGIRFTSMLPGGKVFSNSKYYDVYQPAMAEKTLFDFILLKYQEQIENSDDDRFVEFEVKEYIVGFCGKEMYRSYKERIEQALINMENTIYTFSIDNKKKISNFSFKSKNFSMLKYEKIEMPDGRVIYRVYIFDELKEKIKNKRYIKAIAGPLRELQEKDSIALRIYQYISMTRFESNEGEYDLELLCSIIPLKTFAKSLRVNKKGEVHLRKINLLSQNLKRVVEAFDVMKKFEFLSEFSVEELVDEKSWKIKYIFGEKQCHVSSYTKKREQRKIIEVTDVEDIPNKKSKVTKKEKNNISNKLSEAITFARRNVYISKSYSEKAILELINDYEEEKIIKALKRAKYSAKVEIKFFKAYLKKFIENMDEEKIEFKDNSSDEFEKIENIEVNNIENEENENLIKERNEKIDRLYDALSIEEKQIINEGAKKIYFEQIGVDKQTDQVHINIFKKTEIFYRHMVMNEKYGKI